jgi:hypothetical protein
MADARGAESACTVSIVIPALNEASRLPMLLDCLARQTRQPDEIVVADAGSVDRTAEIARQRGVRVVRGGCPAAGRNAGAGTTSGDLILFMDADAQPSDDFIAKAVDEFERRGLTAATAPMWAADDDRRYRFALRLTEAYLRAVQRVSPHAVGLCILVTREIHDRIGGFDESLVLAEDCDYARRAARIGSFAVLRSVKVPTSMRRLRRQGLMRSARVLVYAELNTLAGIPIRRLPFAYEFGAFEETSGGPDGAGRDGHTPGVRRMLRQLAKPSSELQGDAIGLQVASVLGGGMGALALAVAGAAPGDYLPLAVLTATLAGASTYEALRKTSFERTYSDFLSAAVATASDDFRDASGAVLIRAGLDEVCELHVVKNLGRMAQLSKQGLCGRLTIMLEILEGILALAQDMGDPLYRNVAYVVARSDLTTLLFKTGFSEVPDPPRFDFFNRAEKRLLMWVIGVRLGTHRNGDIDSYRMAIMSKEEFASPEMHAALEALVARARKDLERAQAADRRTRATPASTATRTAR